MPSEFFRGTVEQEVKRLIFRLPIGMGAVPPDAVANFLDAMEALAEAEVEAEKSVVDALTDEVAALRQQINGKIEGDKQAADRALARGHKIGTVETIADVVKKLKEPGRAKKTGKTIATEFEAILDEVTLPETE